MLTNAESIKVLIEQLAHQDTHQRWFAARELGGFVRAKKGPLREEVIKVLQSKVDDTGEDQDVRYVARRSIQEINGEFDDCSEKYKPQEPEGSLRDQYYLKRG